MLTNTKFKNIYYSHYRTILNEIFDKNYIETIINQIRPVIEEYVQKDPKNYILTIISKLIFIMMFKLKIGKYLDF